VPGTVSSIANAAVPSLVPFAGVTTDRIGDGGEHPAGRRGSGGRPARRDDRRSGVRFRRAERPAALGRRGEEDGGRVAQPGGEGDRRYRQAQGHSLGDKLPKTRSGKIMRRLLRSIAKGEEIKQDVSTLENPAILEQLKQST